MLSDCAIFLVRYFVIQAELAILFHRLKHNHTVMHMPQGQNSLDDWLSKVA